MIVVLFGILGLGMWLVWRASSPLPPSGGTQRVVAIRGDAVAWVDEASAAPLGSVGERIARDVAFSSGERARLDVDLDDQGLALAARYVRPGQRTVELRADGSIVVDGRAFDRVPSPVIVIDVLHRLRVTSSLSVSLFEPSSAEWVPALVSRDGPIFVVHSVDGEVIARAVAGGPRYGPGAFTEGDVVPKRPSEPIEIRVPGRESVAGVRLRRGPAPPRADDAVADWMTRPGPFIESDAPAVVSFAAPLCRADHLDAARRIGEAVGQLVDADADAHAPGALAMLTRGGDCDGAAALATAALRACGIPARVVVGYRLIEPGPDARLVPHALAELYPAVRVGVVGSWWRLDPTVPSLTSADERFLPVATGLGGALSMGRVLGAVDEEDLVPQRGPDARP